jgi:hypothetical protein
MTGDEQPEDHSPDGEEHHGRAGGDPQADLAHTGPARAQLAAGQGIRVGQVQRISGG